MTQMEEQRQRLQAMVRHQIGTLDPALESDLLDLLDLMVLSGWSDSRCGEFIGRVSEIKGYLEG